MRVGSSGAVLVQIKPGSHPVAQPLEQQDPGHMMQRLGHRSCLSEVKPQSQQAWAPHEEGCRHVSTPVPGGRINSCILHIHQPRTDGLYWEISCMG